MPAILFGSISTLADTSELQRRAFNEAFVLHGLNWQWSQDDYAEMLSTSGGAQRVADYAASRGEQVDSAAVHATKSEVFQQLLTEEDVTPRPGVVATMERAQQEGYQVGLVTTTSTANVSALLVALQRHIHADAFDLVVDSSSVGEPKPSPAAYAYALERLCEDARSVVAVEDNVGGVTAAVNAGIICVAFPNQNSADGDFTGAAETVDTLDAEHIVELAKS